MKRFFTLEYWREEAWFVGRLKEVLESLAKANRWGSSKRISLTPTA